MERIATTLRRWWMPLRQVLPRNRPQVRCMEGAGRARWRGRKAASRRPSNMESHRASSLLVPGKEARLKKKDKKEKEKTKKKKR